MKYLNMLKSKRNILIITLILIEITSVFLMYKSFFNKDAKLDEVKLNINEINSEMFAIMVEQEDGTYAESTDNAWPEEKIYNEEMSGCIDSKGNKIEGILTYDDINNIATVETSDTAFCYLYFDLMIEDVEFAYTGDYQEYTAKSSGYYYIEAYGAQGGGTLGGAGGYTSGFIQLKEGEKLYVYVGENGGSSIISGTTYYNAGGYNGGGYGGNHADAYSFGGGGATDIRYFGNTELSEDDLVWNSDLGLNSRIMVAAGGAGALYNHSEVVAGSGGGLFGNPGTATSGTYSSSTYYVYGATQIAGGYNSNLSTKSGTWGYALQSTVSGYGGGGGGGYYGGGMGRGNGGSGGSSFISGYAGVNAITSSSDRTHTNNTLHYSGKYFIDAEMKSGVNEGNGKAKISFYGTSAPERVNEGLNKVRYIKECMNQNSTNSYNSVVELQAIYNGTNIAKGLVATLYNSSGTSISENSSAPFSRITDGDITATNYAYGNTYSGEQCFVLDLGKEYNLEEISVWHTWNDSRVYYENVTYTSRDNETWTEIINQETAEISDGKRINAYELSELTPNLYTLCSSYSNMKECMTTEYSGNLKKVINMSQSETGGMMRYQGTRAYNYICFGTSDKDTCTGNTDVYMYRIIGVTSDGQLKVIKKEASYTNYWYSESGVTKDWDDSLLYSALNGSSFLNNSTYMKSGWSDKIVLRDWKFGTISSTSSVNQDGVAIYEIENAFTNTINAKIGLMYLHDYYLAYSDTINYWTTTTKGWIHLSNNDSAPPIAREWLMTYHGYGTNTDGTTAYYAWYVTDSGDVGRWGQHYYENSARPVFYITSDVKIIGGNGTSTSPYLIS